MKSLLSACVPCSPYSAVRQLVPLSSHRLASPRRTPRPLTSIYSTSLAVAKKKPCFHPRPGAYPMSGIMCSQGGHRIAGQMAKAFSSAYTPRHLCLPGIFTSLLRTVQSRKALLPMYLSEGGMASSTRAAQFMKALTRIVWSVIGRRTSLRLVQCTKANSGISSTWVLQRSLLLSSRQLSHACAPRVTKCIGRASAVIPVELKQPGANSLLACSSDSRGYEAHLR